MRKILIFSLLHYPYFSGGAEVAVKEITDRISSSDIEFHMITLGRPKGELKRIPGGVSMVIHHVAPPFFPKEIKDYKVPLLAKILYIPWAAFKALSLHRKDKYDAVWSIMASYAGFAAVIFKIFFPKVPMILTIQEGDHFERRQGFLKPFFKKIFTSASQIQVISNYLADWSKQMGAKCPIGVIPNGVDYEKFSYPITSEKKEEIRIMCKFKKDDVVLVTSSRLVHKNAIDVVIKAVSQLPEKYKFLILGVGPNKDELLNQANNLKLQDRVVFKGFVPHDVLPEYLQASDIFIRPSRTEGLGNSFIEAMAAGIPVIATPVGGIPDFLVDGETGLFCEVDNPESIVQKVEKLTKDKESREYIVKNAHKMVKDKYDWKSVAEKMEKIFNTAQ